MRIISKFKDYYDSAAFSFGYDSDPNIKYIRETSEYFKYNRFYYQNDKPEKFYYQNVEAYEKYIASEICTYTGVIFFCGKAYQYFDIPLSYMPYNSKFIVFGIDKLLGILSSEAFIEARIKEASENLDCNAHWVRKDIKKLHDEFLSRKQSFKMYEQEKFTFKDVYDIGDDFFKEMDCPIMQLDNNGYFTKNPNLGKIKFQQVIDPYTAFQEIEMYLGNNLAKQMDPDVKMSDEVKAEIHGFDKWSFRTKVR